MAYTLKDGLKFVYNLIGQTGGTASVGMGDSFIYVANSALNMLYNYEGYRWTRQHSKALFKLSSPNQLSRKLLVPEPIKEVDKFYSTTWKDVDKFASACEMDCDIKDDTLLCAYDCMPCFPPCQDLGLTNILPQNQLCAGEYAVTGGNYEASQGGLEGRIIQVSLERPVDTLWVTYFKDVKHMKSFDDILPIPDGYLTARAFFCAGHIVPLYGIMMQQQDLNFFSLARKELDALKKGDNIFHKKVQYNDNAHPLTTRSNIY